MSSIVTPAIAVGSTLLAVALIVPRSPPVIAPMQGPSASYDDRWTPSPVPSQIASSAAQSGPAAIGRDGNALSADEIALGEKIRTTLALYEPKHLNARDNTCWEVMHNLIAFGPRTEIYRDGPGGQAVNAMGWLCYGGRCQGMPLISLRDNKPHGMYGVGLEGHDGQYLGMLAQWKVLPESPMRIDGRDFTVADYIEEEKDTCQSGTELTFKLIALAHYLPSDATWTSRNGEQWSIPKLIRAEIEAPIHGATCGGSHRLFAIANAVKERAKRGEPIDGQWARAAKYTGDYQRYTLANLQNPDGSFSTEWFNRPADRPGDLDRKLQTTGHMLEWLVWSLPDDELHDSKVEKAVDFLSGILLNNPDRTWSIGPLGHSLHALMIYHQRVYRDVPLPAESVAGQSYKAPVKVASVQNPPEPSCEKDNGTAPEMIEPAKPAVVKPSTARARPMPDELLHMTLGPMEVSAVAPAGQ
jgi:hypothetical protein